MLADLSQSQRVLPVISAEQSLKMWGVLTTIRDFFLSREFFVSLVAGLFSGILIFLVGLRWRLVTSYLSRERAAFRCMFGAGAIEAGVVMLTLDTYRDLRLLPPEVQQRLGVAPIQVAPSQGHRFFKVFPDGHATAFPGAYGDILGYRSARGAAYLVNVLGGVPGITVRAVSDWEVSSQWKGTFVNLGSSASNIKTNDIKHLQENVWLQDDLGRFEFKDGRVVTIEDRTDKGIILKLVNPYFPEHSVFVCAGLGEWGTSGAAWFLSAHWRLLTRRFRRNPFLVVVRVTIGSDESARELLAFGEESLLWRMRAWIGLGRGTPGT